MNSLKWKKSDTKPLPGTRREYQKAFGGQCGLTFLYHLDNVRMKRRHLTLFLCLFIKLQIEEA